MTARLLDHGKLGQGSSVGDAGGGIVRLWGRRFRATDPDDAECVHRQMRRHQLVRHEERLRGDRRKHVRGYEQVRGQGVDQGVRRRVRGEEGPLALTGVGLRACHYAHVLEHGVRSAQWLEVAPENFFEPGGRPWAALLRARRDVPIALHGVSLGIGDTDPISDRYIESLERVIERVEPAMVSDHLCWGAFGGRYAHDLLPMPYTAETLAHVASRVTQVQERLGRELVLENVSRYIDFRASVLGEAEFLNELARRTGCGVLLDVNNVYVTSRNLGIDAEKYVDTIEHVREIHLAGYSDKGDVLIDTHSAPVSDPVWALYRRATDRLGRVPTLLEWDDEIPPWDELVAEANRAEVLG